VPWWDSLKSIDPGLGYFPQPAETWLLVKSHLYVSALKKFEASNISITQEGRPCLGSRIGTSSFVHQFVNKVASWVSEIEELSNFASQHPHCV